MQSSQESEDGDGSHSPSRSPARKKVRRSRAVTACNICRSRRTKCDNQKPSCTYCRARDLVCIYDQANVSTTTRIEAELASINQKLDYISSSLQAPVAEHHAATNTTYSSFVQPDQDDLTQLEKSPFQLLGTEPMMAVFGLQGFAAKLHTAERNAAPAVSGSLPRLRLIQHQAALAGLAAFSAHVHIWYPIIQPGFSEKYIRVISGPLLPSSESCLVLLVAAIGFLAQQDPMIGNGTVNNFYDTYLEAAMPSLPAVLVDDGIDGIQCLILLAIYHCCLSKPCHAHDYTMIASLKVQNLLLHLTDEASEDLEQARRAYWAILLLESELRVHFEVTDSGIWDHDSDVALPNSRRAWQFDVDQGSPNTSITSPAGLTPLIGGSTDKTQCYFLAEIAMRRMLHRCNTAIRKTGHGQIVYAPGIAAELELQLDEWYSYLPDMIRFDKHQDLDFDVLASPSLYPVIDPLCNFLRVQYYCCKISIYWPAVYQCIQQNAADPPLLQDCSRFFDAYIQLMPSILISVRECIVNRWTLYASIFMTSMAAMLAAQTKSIRQQCPVDWNRLSRCLEATRMVDARLIQASPSLPLLADELSNKLAQSNAIFSSADI